MGEAGSIIAIIVVVTIIWMGFESSSKRISIDNKPYSINNGALAWIVSAILLWIVTFPYYLVKRTKPPVQSTEPQLVKPVVSQSNQIIIFICVMIGLGIFIYLMIELGHQQAYPAKPAQQQTTQQATESKPVQTANKLVISSASASSAVSDQQFGAFPPQNVLDGDPYTCWQEWAEGNGIGQWIQVELGKEETVEYIGVINGFAYPDHPNWGDVFTQNPRVKKATLSFSNGASQAIDLKDSYQQQIIKISKQKTSWVKLVIEDVYPGSQYHDTSISEISLYGIGAEPQPLAVAVSTTAPVSSAIQEKKSGEWYEGGNLHQLTGKEWQAAGDDNRLATSSDFVAKLQKENLLKVKFSNVEELKLLSIQLDVCITKATEGPGESQRVAEIAGLCTLLMRWRS